MIQKRPHSAMSILKNQTDNDQDQDNLNLSSNLIELENNNKQKKQKNQKNDIQSDNQIPKSKHDRKKKKKKLKDNEGNQKIDSEDNNHNSIPEKSHSPTVPQASHTISNQMNSTSSISILNHLLKQPVIDNELDNLFKSTSFPALKTDPTTAKANDLTSKLIQNSSNSASPNTDTIIENQIENHPQAELKPQKTYPNTSKMKSSKAKISHQASAEVAYETQQAINRAKLFAEALKQEISSKSDSNAKLAKPIKIDVESSSDEPTITFSDQQTNQEETNEPNQSQLKHQKEKLNDLNETSEQLQARTVFIGNVNIECATSKSCKRALLDHLFNPLKDPSPLAPSTRIESIRFRAIPLATPITPDNQLGQRSSKRSQAWKECQITFDDSRGGPAGHRGAKGFAETDSLPNKAITSLTPAQKRKIGFVTKNIHPEAKSCIAYLVISNTQLPHHESNPLSAQELAKLIVTKADGTSFMGHILRCDLACRNSSSKANLPTIDLDQQRRTLFIGGLDFNEQEDSIRQAIEARLVEENIALPEGFATFVERVRIVRDKATALAKGFAYVLFKTREAVEEMLALPEGSFKIGKRKVRLQKYITAARSSALKQLGQPITDKQSYSSKSSKAGKLTKTESSKRPPLDLTQEIVPVYKGEDMSQKLKTLSKSERKKIKSDNSDRVERRLLKKQAKLRIKLLSKKLDQKIQNVNKIPKSSSKAKTQKHAESSKKKKKSFKSSES
ncbi:hypothetical protein O181_003302 [Austropuccinia psidii MF-1]|uniref:Nucleolar protein 12 n=1 Tax=Austropuccinia psidii MF-1 TaxID=1389203 RepID=A0A9Q3GET0_9BASI|nr:hypothetical protein [Austropuccinia psidii MF-1]